MTDAPPPAYSQPVQPAVNPGQTLGIVALIVSIVSLFIPIALVSLILGIVARNQSKKVGMKNGFAVAAIWISAVLIVLSIIVIILVIAAISVVGFSEFEQIILDPSFAP
ncbi:hypothetical protein EV140_1592 [Microcella alkaliphila]|uniref:DUF4190 domain-containing protein n=1 Tax=Microcella alkaliphila TaxID=279828 RepID=A0A4Q7TGN4_9MICO|nr:DUF4190 domain-containing protein [Microcella alkaliphila]RZT59611.1 hypothetical protein EV140_1592 [Microcella alkaliphila]